MLKAARGSNANDAISVVPLTLPEVRTQELQEGARPQGKGYETRRLVRKPQSFITGGLVMHSLVGEPPQQPPHSAPRPMCGWGGHCQAPPALHPWTRGHSLGAATASQHGLAAFSAREGRELRTCWLCFCFAPFNTNGPQLRAAGRLQSLNNWHKVAAHDGHATTRHPHDVFGISRDSVRLFATCNIKHKNHCSALTM